MYFCEHEHRVNTHVYSCRKQNVADERTSAREVKAIPLAVRGVERCARGCGGRPSGRVAQHTADRRSVRERSAVAAHNLRVACVGIRKRRTV